MDQKRDIYLITPSWLVKDRKDFLNGAANLEKIGFRIHNKKFLRALPSPELKAREIHKAFLDKNSSLILAQRGGYSSMKVLPHIDFDLIKNNPKTLAGFSDLSTLLNSIFERTGLVTLHAPMLINFTPLRKFTLASFLNALRCFPEKDIFRGAPVKIFNKGKASGTLKGGNLVTLSSLIGTQWDIDTDNCIIFLEDVDEELHRVDRYLTQWILSGKFRKIKGLVLGDFRGIKPGDVYNILSSQMKIKFPVVHCPFIGHVNNKITLPIGAKVELDAAKNSLRVL